MEIPDGFMTQAKNDKQKVWKLKKSLYGLKTSQKNWNLQFSEHVKKLGFTVSTRDPCLFMLAEKETIIILQLFVDDILLTGNDEERMNKIQRELGNKLDIKLLGEPKKFLGLTINRDKKAQVITLDQVH